MVLPTALLLLSRHAPLRLTEAGAGQSRQSEADVDGG
jgi:hypothetical protein